MDSIELQRASNLKTKQLSRIMGSLHESYESLELLKAVLRDPKATFQSEGQYHLTMLCQKGVFDIIGRLPCGIGKTESIIIGTKTVKEKFHSSSGRIITIAVLLLVTLIPDYQQRMIQSGLSCEQWNSSTTLQAPPDVLIVQVEDLEHPALYSQLSSIPKEKKPHFCVIDEFDAFLDSSNFRPTLKISQMKLLCKNFIYFH